MNVKLLLTMFAILLFFSCANEKPSAVKQNVAEKDTVAKDSLVGVMETENDYCTIHTKMQYFDFDKVKDLRAFFDGLASKHEKLIYVEECYKLDDCLSRIEKYRRGEIKYYPDSLVKEVIDTFGFYATQIDNNRPGADLTIAEWFLMLAAYYSPDITCLVNMQSPDHFVGVLNFGNGCSGNLWWAFLVLKREVGYEVMRLRDDNVRITKLFQLEDENKRRYYLCSNNTSLGFLQILFWRKNSTTVMEVGSCERVHDVDTHFDELYFDPKTLVMSYCKEDTKTGKMIPVSTTPAMTLHLDGMNSRFNIDF